MKYFGTAKSFDATLALGEINPEVAGNPIRLAEDSRRGQQGSAIPAHERGELHG